MSARFTRRGDRIVGRLSGTERAIVAGLIGQTRELLAPEVIPTGDPLADLDALLNQVDLSDEPGRSQIGAGDPAGDTAALRDPALARLLPDAHRGDPKVAAEFRALAEQDLRQRKYQRFTEAILALQVDDAAADDRLELTKEQAETIAIALTDVRLLLADRLGLHTDEDIEALERAVVADDKHELAYPFTVYDFLTWMQDSMLGALTSRRFLF